MGIERASKGIDGMEAMRLWERYIYNNNRDALQALLQYNREDVVNLVHLENYLGRIPATEVQR